jgi:uncharacterized protein (TIGR02118 family)
MAVKLTIIFGPPQDPDAFVEHYVGIHVPLVEAQPGVRSYEYGRALPNFDGSPPDAFWVVTLTFDDVQAMHASFATPEGRLTVEDTPKFLTGTMKTYVSEVS